MKIANPSLAEKLGDVALRARQDLEVSRHVFADKVTYVLRDPITFESHRFSVADYEVFVAMSAEEPLGEVFEQLVEKEILTERAKEDFFNFAANLVHLGLVGLPGPDGKMLYHRAEQRSLAMRNNVLKNFLFQQIPLFNPDRFLDRTIHLVRFVFSKWFVTVWACGIIAALAIVIGRWSDFTSPLADILTLRNIPLVWGVLFGLKIVHEFGHAYACKHFGGRVPAMGLYLIAGNPCAFVDASAAWGFPSRFHRIVVSLGGMYVESIVGIVAVFVWAFSGSPALQSLAHHVIFMATAVTLLFNANPLMKYDGYFILCDATGFPNLRQRSTNEVGKLLKRWVLGLDHVQTKLELSTVALVSYGIASSIYKVVVVLSISSMVAARFALLGLAMAGYYVISTVYGMYSTALRYLWTSPEVQPIRTRARTLGYCLLATVPLLLLLPIPTGVRSTGRVAAQNEIEISNEVPGIVRGVHATPGQRVGSNTPIITLENEAAVEQLVQDTRQLNESQLRYHYASQVDRDAAAKTAEQIHFLESQFQFAESQLESLEVRADRDGVLMTCLPDDEVGQFLPPGSTVAVVGSGPWVVKLLATAETMVSAQPKVGKRVQVRLRSQPGRLLQGTITRVAKAGSREINDESLTHLAGGMIPVNPTTNEATESYFEIFVQPDSTEDVVFMQGMTADVRFDRKLELIGQGIYRRVAKFINQVLTS